MPAVRSRLVDQRQRSDVSTMRDVAVRAQGPEEMSRRRGVRSGVSTRVANDVAGRVHDIRAVWSAVQNDPHQTVEDLAGEFFFAVGELLEGRPLRSLQFHKISRERVLAHAEE